MPTQLLSAEAYRIFARAKDLLRRLFLNSNDEPGPEHVLLALLQDGGGGCAGPLQRAFGEKQYLVERSLFEETLRTPADTLDQSCERFMRELEQIAANRDAKYTHEGDLLRAAVRSGSPAIAGALRENGFSESQVLQSLEADVTPTTIENRHSLPKLRSPTANHNARHPSQLDWPYSTNTGAT